MTKYISQYHSYYLPKLINKVTKAAWDLWSQAFYSFFFFLRFKNIYIYLFIWLHWVLVAAGGLSCGMWAP